MVVKLTKILVTATIMVYFILLIIFALNLHDKSKIIKGSFIAFIITLFLFTFFFNELIMDYLISIFIRFYYFPSFSSIIMVLLFSMGMFIWILNNEKLAEKYRIINIIFIFFIFIGYIIFMIMDIDVNSYSELYNGSSLKCLRYISRTFYLWIIVLVSIKYCKYLVKRR